MTDLHPHGQVPGERDAEVTGPIRLPNVASDQRVAHPAVGLGPVGAPQYTQPPPSNGFGITALCLGVVGAVFSLVPLTGFLAVILGGLALVFGLLGWGRVRRGVATNKGVTISGTVLGAVSLVMGIIGIVVMVQATAQFSEDMNRLADTGSSSSPLAPYTGAPAAPERPAATSYTYGVTGNYRATQIHFTDSNGDSVTLNETGNINTAGSSLPWTKTVSPEPNGNFQSLNASTLSSRGDSWITCTITDNTGAVVASETGRGAYAGCYASTPFN